MRKLIIFIMVLLSVYSTSAADEGECPSRPRIGLVLSGGGARGAAHVGILQVLEANRVPIDFIVGTSMGSIVGGMYASGMPPDELEETITRIDWENAFSDRPPRTERSFRRKRDDDLYLIKNRPGISSEGLQFPSGLIDGQHIDLLLKRYTLPVVTLRDFDELAIPFRAVAADLETGAARVLEGGDLALAIRASMAIPVVFAPREVQGKLMVDGGISKNLAIDEARKMGADIVIAVDISTPLKEREELVSLLDVTDQLMTIMTRRNTEEQIRNLGPQDIFISPDLGDITTASFDRAADAIPAGREAAENVLDRLRKLSLSKEKYRQYLSGRNIERKFPLIDRVRIINDSMLSDRTIIERISQETGDYLDVDILERDLNRIYGLELFESVYYDVTEEAGRNILTISAREASWGPNYLNFGIAVFEDFEGPNFNMALAYTRTAVNSLNGEWRSGIQIGQEPGLFTELYQPLEKKLKYFVHIRANADEKAWNMFDSGGNKLSEFGIRKVGAEIAAGREIGTWGELRAGVIRETGEFSVQVGDPSIPDRRFERGEFFGQIFIDELDKVMFPGSGATLKLTGLAGRRSLGSDRNYEQYAIECALAHTIGRNTALFSGHFATTGGGNAPLQSLFRLGGFKKLSGLERDELKGQQSALISAAFYRRLGGLLMQPLYGGVTIEYGNVFDKRDDIRLDRGIASGSAFLGLDTVVGAICAGYGISENRRSNYYLFLGKSFDHWGAGIGTR